MSDDKNVSPNSDQRRKRRLVVFEDSSSDSSVENPARRRRRKIYIQSDSESDSDSSLELSKRKRVARVNSDSSDSSDSEVVRRVKKNAKLESDSGNDESSGWESEDKSESEDNPEQESQPSSSKALKIDEDHGTSSDSSDGQAEKCPICLISFKNQEVGSPEACDHSFCADCIQEWAKSVNTCPVDRRKFNLILVRSNYDGAYVRSIPVQEPSNNALGDPIEDEIDFTPCEVCGSSINEDRLLLCDGCDLAYHLDCLNPPLSEVPEGEWFCPACRNTDLVDIDILDLDFLFQDEENGIANIHHRYGAPRLIPRTRQSERIRTRIVHQRGQNPENNDTEATNPPSAEETNQQPGPGPSTTRRATSKTTTRKKKPIRRRKRKCKKSRKPPKPRYKIIYEIDETTGEKIAIKKKARKYKKKKKYKKRKIKVRRVFVPKSVKNRLARQLGICPPQRAGQSLPDMKMQVNPGDIGHRRSQAGIPALHLFGQRDQLDYFSGSDSEIAGAGVNILVGRRPNISDAAVLRRAARNKAAALSAPTATTSVDVLGSILDTQAKFHSKNSIISVRRDGSLKIDVDKKMPIKDKPINVEGRNVRIRQTPMMPNTTTNGGSASPSNSSHQYREQSSFPNYENSVPTSTVGSSDVGGVNNFNRENQDEDGPQDYSLNRLYSIYEPSDSKDKKNKSEDSTKDAAEENTPTANSDSELDIYSDIETVSTSKIEDSDVKYPSPAPVEAASVTNAADDDNESDTDLIIDTEKVDPDKYDPAAAFESDNDEDTKEEAVTSTSESVTVTKHSDYVPAPWNSEIQSETVQSSNLQSETVQSSNQTEFRHPGLREQEENEKQADEENEEPEDDCPNHSIYSSESLNLAKNTDLNMLITPSDIQDDIQEKDDTAEDKIDKEDQVDKENEVDKVDDAPTFVEPSSTPVEDTNLDKKKKNKSKKSKKVHSGLYSDSEDESVVKINPQKPFGIGDIRNMTEDISEEERSYTPCLDEKEPVREGLEGLDTEMISDDDKNDFEEAQEHEQELKTASDGDALEINAKESELDFTRPEDCEEGEIIDKLKTKKPEDADAPEEPEEDEVAVTPKSKEKDSNNKENEGSNKEPVFKKLSKSNKERNYRGDKENKERSKSKDKKDKPGKENKKEKKKERRKEIPRYDVRTVVETKPKRDKFGRDPTRRWSYDSSKSATPPRRFGRDEVHRRSGSRSSRSASPRRFGREVRRRSASYSSRSATPPPRRSLSRGRNKSHSPTRKRRGRSLTRSKSRGHKRSRSRLRKRPQSSSRDRRKSGRKSSDRAKRKSRKAKSRSPSRRRDWERRRSRGWSPSLSRSRSPEPRHFTPSWTPPRMMNQSVRPQNLTVILPNDSNKKRKEKRRKQDKKGKDTNDRQKKRRRSDRSPPPSKEVFASGNNILVSVSFNKDNEEHERSKRRREIGEELTTRRMRKEKEKQGKTTRVRRRTRNANNIKPVAIIDLDRSPFKEITPSPKDVIVLSDSDNADSNDLLGLQKALRRDTSEQAASPEVTANNNYINSMGPKTPPEPQVKFSFNSKQPQLRQITNPLHEPDDVEEEIDPQEELENRLNEVMHKGPNTPPEPPNSPPSSPDAYDPFDPTKSRTPTPEPKQSNVQSSVTQSIEDTQEEPDRSAVGDISEKSGTPTAQISASKSHTPPIPIADIQPADSQSSVRAITPDTNLTSSPERPIGVVINQMVQSQAGVFPTVSKPVAPTVYSSGSTSLITSTPVSSNLSVPRINILSSSVITPPIVTSSVPQRIVLPNTTKSSPINKVSPSKTPVKLTPIKPMPSKNIAKLPLPNKGGWKSKNRNTESNDVNLDFDSPYSPGSSDYEDLFEPPPDTGGGNTKSSAKPTQGAKNTKTTKSPAKNPNAFDALFGSSPVYTSKNKSKSKAKTKKSTQHASKGTKQVGVKLDEDNLKILDELPNSAVEMQVKDKFLKKLNRQERVVEEVKFVLKPYYNKKRITKEEYKDILRRAVPKICHNKSGEINPKKIQALVEAYVKKVRHNKKVTSSSSVNPQKTEVVSNWLSKLN